jgi:hypothetical protein
MLHVHCLCMFNCSVQLFFKNKLKIVGIHNAMLCVSMTEATFNSTSNIIYHGIPIVMFRFSMRVAMFNNISNIKRCYSYCHVQIFDEGINSYQPKRCFLLVPLDLR